MRALLQMNCGAAQLRFRVLTGADDNSNIQIEPTQIPHCPLVAQRSHSEFRGDFRRSRDPVGGYRRSRGRNDCGIFLPTHHWFDSQTVWSVCNAVRRVLCKDGSQMCRLSNPAGTRMRSRCVRISKPRAVCWLQREFMALWRCTHAKGDRLLRSCSSAAGDAAGCLSDHNDHARMVCQTA